MKRYTYLLAFLLLTACGPASPVTVKLELAPLPPPPPIPPNDPSDSIPVSDQEANTSENKMVTYFVVIADTGQRYSDLHTQMFYLHQQTKIEIDTMGRYYDTTKDRIMLPEDDDDEIFAGDYFIRRTPSETLSLEYLSSYQKAAGEKTIALVRGIYETEEKAQKAVQQLRNNAPRAFFTRSELYMGCLH